MKILCLTDFPIQDGYRWFWSFLPFADDDVTFLHSAPDGRLASAARWLGAYPAYFTIGLKALRQVRRTKFDLVVAWEVKSGFSYALLRRWLVKQGPPLVILTLGLRGPLKRLVWLRRRFAQGLDYATVPTRCEQGRYAQILGLPSERLIHCPIGVRDLFHDLPPAPPGDFIFSGGQSGRDYRTLLEAVTGLPIPLVVNAPLSASRRLPKPGNVTFNNLLPRPQYRDLHRAARFVVVPLQPVDEAVGLTAILTGLAAGRAIVSSQTPAAQEYLDDGKTGLLVPPGDVQALRKAILHLWEHSELCEQMGRRARQVYEERYNFTSFAFRTHQILTKIYQDSLA